MPLNKGIFILEERHNMVLYSPSMLNTFIECPTKYFLRYIENTTTPQLESKFSIGKNIHAIAAYYLKGEDISMFQLSEKENKLWNTLLSFELFKLPPLMVESNMMIKISDFWIGGRIDALVKNNKNEYFILDYKTGEIPRDAKDDFQTIIYLLCCDKHIPEYKSLNFTYISVKTGKSKTIQLTPELKKYYEEKIIKTIQNIQEIIELKKIEIPICKTCSYNKTCV